MGLGDELMALGEAKSLYMDKLRKISIVDKYGKPRSHEYWEKSPYIDYNSDVKLKNCIGHRPYINKVIGRKIKWNEYKPIPADLTHITSRSYIDEYIVLEPNTKVGATVNKQWIKSNFVEVVNKLPELKFVQLGNPTWKVPGVETIKVKDLYHLADIMSKAYMYVGIEGGLHHLSAAFRVPAIVIYGGFISSKITGYDYQCNLDFPGEECGSLMQCSHCRDLMGKITPDIVIEKIMGLRY